MYYDDCCKIVLNFSHMLCPICEIVERLLQDCCRIIANLLRLLQDCHNLTQPNLTQPYLTQPNPTKPNPPNSSEIYLALRRSGDELVAKTPLLSINSCVRGLCPLYPRSCGGLGISHKNLVGLGLVR